ncbi:MAG: peptidoglycan DD-metalloendopeptidase family protein [Gammaproteobacteria bacterium]|nr:peptidoglycan DD-metalloendopeptidase family protein [Gammaproteobacteria bacterium]
MKDYKLFFIITILISFFISYTPAYAFPRHNPVPGGLALIPINTDLQPKVYFNKKPVAIISDQSKSYAMVGIPLTTSAGKQSVQIKWPDNSTENREFIVQPKTYQAQYLTIKNKRKVNPNAQDMERISKERVRKNKAKKLWSNQDVNANFLTPVQGRVSSIFGLRRFFNEQPRRPHSGLDIAAPEGTPIMAIENGRVIEAGDFFFSGNMVYLDHGQGVISLYAHMHQINVKVGDMIKKGQVIGTVGETGRVTGPHLHLGIYVNQTLVDPVFLLPEQKKQTK